MTLNDANTQYCVYCGDEYEADKSDAALKDMFCSQDCEIQSDEDDITEQEDEDFEDDDEEAKFERMD